MVISPTKKWGSNRGLLGPRAVASAAHDVTFWSDLMTTACVAGEESLLTKAEDWVQRFQACLDAGDPDGCADLFVDDSAWRDLVAFDWTNSTVATKRGILDALRTRLPNVRPVTIRMEEGTEPVSVVRAGVECVEVFLSLNTCFGNGRGVLRLVPSEGRPDEYRAWTISTALMELTGFEEINGARRPSRYGESADFRGANWLDMRTRSVAYEDREPDVLIVGGGQAGLDLAARLGQLQVDALVVDRWPRIGDNWRERYHTLTLHNEVWTCHMPYMPFPETWPTYVPKDKLANWFESYVDAMEINYWTGTELATGSYSYEGGRWRIVLRRTDNGTERVVSPRHVVLATGVSGIPNIPNIPGLADYRGTVLHTSKFTGGGAFEGKRVVVIGTGNSAHDVAQDLYAHRADVTMLQRGATTVVNLEPASLLPAEVYGEGRKLDDIDLLGVSTPFPFSLKSQQLMTDRMRELDTELIDRLTEVGFRTDYADDGGGILSKYATRGGGYYINVGCSDLIIEGKIVVRQWDEIDQFTATGIRFADGSTIAPDAIILATGYKSIQAMVEEHFGQEVANQVGPVWGLDASGELANVWKRTSHPGLWFAAGSLIQCRVLSRYLALQLKATLEGLTEGARADQCSLSLATRSL